jgi:DNA-binding HxlR family transcriptional regulator
LVEAGVTSKEPYSEHPPRYDYRLTDKGRDLWPVLTAMRQWAPATRPLRDRPSSSPTRTVGRRPTRCSSADPAGRRSGPGT